MSVQDNPFLYGRPVESRETLVDRAQENADLLECVRTGQPVMIHAPRRYGKTSLARVVAQEVEEEWNIPTVYVDFWGAASIADVVNVLGRAYAGVSNVFKVRRFIADLLSSVGFRVRLGHSLSVSYEGWTDIEQERSNLRTLLEVPRALASRAPVGRVLMILDEFGELLNVPGEPDAVMRNVFQASPDVSYIFMGSKRSLMDGLFADRKRPFYNFGRRMELGRLPYEALGEFVEERFGAAGKRITQGAVDVLLDFSAGHPYRAQQLAFHTFRLTGERSEADEEAVLEARDEALLETNQEFRAILDEMSPPRRAVLIAFCKEPPDEPHSRAYMQRHGIKGSGALTSAINGLTASGYLEKQGRRAVPTDPLLALWIRERMSV